MEKFKKEFIKSLVLPKKLNDIKIPENVTGGVRINKNKIIAVYLKDVKSIKKFKNKHIILKFNYIESNFIFNKIYLCEDGFNDIGYDKNLNIVSKDLVLYNYNRSFGTPLCEDKTHTKNILKEWKKINKYLAINDYDEGFISAYKIERNGEKIKIPYIVSSDRIILPKINNLDKILSNSNPTYGFKYVCKCEIKEEKIIKDSNNIYIIA